MANIVCRTIENLYVASVSLPETICNLVTTGDIWHKRLGHISEAYMKEMNLSTSKNLSSPWGEGRASRQPLKNQELPRSKVIGELIYSDVGGPIRKPTSIFKQ